MGGSKGWIGWGFRGGSKVWGGATGGLGQRDPKSLQLVGVGVLRASPPAALQTQSPKVGATLSRLVPLAARGSCCPFPAGERMS